MSIIVNLNLVMTFKEKLKVIIELESNNYDLHKIEILKNVPLWRLIRNDIRTEYLKSETSFNNKSRANSIDFSVYLSSILNSILDILKLLTARKALLIFSLPRYMSINNRLTDKLTDGIGLILNQNNQKFKIIDRNPNSTSKNRRLPNKTLNISLFIITSKVLSYLLSIITFLVFKKSISRLQNNVRPIYGLVHSWKIAYRISEFIILSKLYQILFAIIKPPSVVIVNRNISYEIIYACKLLDIPNYELQHGITLGQNVLYSGIYNNMVDPDYFCIFSDHWKKPYFSIPIEKLITLGCSYSKLIQTHKGNSDKILIISSPDSTDNIFNIISRIARKNNQLYFIYRLHPQEDLSTEQYEILKKISNISLDKSNIDSLERLSEVNIVIGENSSVLFEAIMLGKAVGRLNYDGVTSLSVGDNSNGFKYLQSDEDVVSFIIKSKMIDLREKREFSEYYKEVELEDLIKYYYHA